MPSRDAVRTPCGIARKFSLSTERHLAHAVPLLLGPAMSSCGPFGAHSRARRRLTGELGGVQRGVASAAREQILVRSDFDDAATVDVENLMGAPDRAQSMRDDQGRATGQELIERFFDQALRVAVERTRRLVEDQDARVA